MAKRAVWKLPYIHSIFFKKSVYLKKALRLKIRYSNVSSFLKNSRIKIHNGIWYISKEMLSNTRRFKLGEFAFTRKCDTQIHLRRKTKKKSKHK